MSSVLRMSTQLAVLTRKLAKLQTGDGQVDANSDEVLARIESQNRDLRRQNKELSAKISTARRNPRKSRPGTAPMAARASPSRSTRSWIPPSGGGAEFEAKLRKILQVWRGRYVAMAQASLTRSILAGA